MKILIADDHELVLDTLVAFITAAGGIDVATVPDLPSAQAKIASDGPFDLVLLDLNMPGMNGLAGLQACLAMDGAPRVALLTGETSRAVADKALEMGAAGFVPKTLAAKSLVNAIRFMAMGEQYLPAGFHAEDPQTDRHPLAAKLTERELQVLKGLTEGKSNKEIARDLDLSEPTVKLHVKTLCCMSKRYIVSWTWPTGPRPHWPRARPDCSDLSHRIGGQPLCPAADPPAQKTFARGCG